MSAYLLDVNVLIALIDDGHVHHAQATDWFASTGKDGWATCSITLAGVVRIVSQPAYVGLRATPSEVMAVLAGWTAHPGHTFWPDDVFLLNRALIRPDRITHARDVTDTHLLALAVRNGGRLATFDRKLRTAAVVGAEGAIAYV